MLGLYMPLLMNLLLTEGEEAAASGQARTQHQLVLAKLTNVGAQFPQDFKVLLTLSMGSAVMDLQDFNTDKRISLP